MRLFAGTPFDRPPVCDRCEQPESECRCPPIAPVKQLLPPEKQTARLTVEKRKKGKVVTAVRGLSVEGTDLPALLTKLKGLCGAGGNLDGETLEIQGNHLERLRALLAKIGYRVSG
jgi:translation initiation factor 1